MSLKETAKEAAQARRLRKRVDDEQAEREARHWLVEMATAVVRDVLGGPVELDSIGLAGPAANTYRPELFVRVDDVWLRLQFPSGWDDPTTWDKPDRPTVLVKPAVWNDDKGNPMVVSMQSVGTYVSQSEGYTLTSLADVGAAAERIERGDYTEHYTSSVTWLKATADDEVEVG